MPFKARQFYHRRNKAPKMQPKRDWSDYNKKMKMRGYITIWGSVAIFILALKIPNEFSLGAIMLLTHKIVRMQNYFLR